MRLRVIAGSVLLATLGCTTSLPPHDPDEDLLRLERADAGATANTGTDPTPTASQAAVAKAPIAMFRCAAAKRGTPAYQEFTYAVTERADCKRCKSRD